MQSLGKITLCAPAVGAKTWCLYFFCKSVTLRGQRAVHSRVTYFEQVLCRGLWVDFDTVYTDFFSIDRPLKCTRQYLFLLLGCATIFAKLCSKNSKSPKISGKVCGMTSYRQLRDLKEIPLQQFRAENVDVHLYKKNFARRYIALTASVEVRIGCPKTARNEQVCAHQKSYRK